jgi:hypothetical protein
MDPEAPKTCKLEAYDATPTTRCRRTGQPRVI